MDNYKLLLQSIGTALKPYNFKKNGSTFYISESNNYGLLNFQKSKSSTANEISFTVNIGTCSAALRHFFRFNDVSGNPLITDCHWRKRIGEFMPQQQDHWWQLKANDSIDRIVTELVSILIPRVIGEIKKHISDDDLERDWLNGNSGGITDVQRYVYLTTLLKIHKKENFKSIIEEFRAYAKGKLFETTARIHIEEMEST